MRNPASRRAFLLLALALLPLGGCAPALARPAAQTTTVVVVRHAERASETDRDPPLSPAGETRARDLAETLADAGVSAVYATQYRRTQDTARPLAERLGLAVRVEDAGSAEAATSALARKILAEHAGETVLVVGHSNTVHLVVRALGGAAVEPLESGDYDRLFVVLVAPDGSARTLRTRFGAGNRQ